MLQTSKLQAIGHPDYLLLIILLIPVLAVFNSTGQLPPDSLIFAAITYFSGILATCLAIKALIHQNRDGWSSNWSVKLALGVSALLVPAAELFALVPTPSPDSNILGNAYHAIYILITAVTAYFLGILLSRIKPPFFAVLFSLFICYIPLYAITYILNLYSPYH